MKGSLKLGSILGIGVFIHWTFIFLIGFIIYSDRKSGYNTIQILWSLLFIASMFITILLHELGHALAAKKYKIKTRDITLLPIGGLARVEKLPEKPKEEFIVAIAGPLVNIGLAIITALFINLPDQQHVVELLSKGVNYDNFFLNFFIVNIFLGLFNLVPAFPMDGGRILRALLCLKFKREVATNIASRVGQAIAVLFFIAGFFVSPTLIFIGIFVFIGAQAENQYTEINSVLKGYIIKDIVMHQYQTIDVKETIKTAVDLLLNGQNKNFLITDNNEPVGTLGRSEIIKALTNKGEDEFIYNVMNKNLVFMNADMPLENAIKIMQQHNSVLMPVMENKQFIGVVDNENILEFIMIKEATHK